ncbi:MAG: response regulator [Marmoricola sp.]
MSQPLRVFLLDDHEIVRRGVRALLESEGDVDVVGEASTVADAARQIAELLPDVAVLDARLPDGSGIDLCARLRETVPGVRSLILTSYDDEEAIVSAIRAGAAGYVLKEVQGDSLLSAVRTVASGQSLIDPVMARRVINWIEQVNAGPEELAGLTDQQLRILELLAEGLTNREIGLRLYLAEKTVKNHVTRILATLGVQRRTQAALLASRLLPKQMTGSHLS